MLYFFKQLQEQFTLPLTNPILIFSLILLIILLSPIVLKRLRIPGIIGLILSGVIIGPHGLNILEQTSAVELFSTIGLLYIMFIAGLELDLNEFKINQHKSIIYGMLTFLLPIIIGFPICYYGFGYSFNASSLVGAMFATQTLISYPIVSRFGLAKNQAVAITVGGTILTDTAVLIILSIIKENQLGELNHEFWIRTTISLIIFSIILFVIIPRIATWFFRKLENEKYAQYIFVLSVVFFAAFLGTVAGFEPIIGAFAAGIALNRLIPSSSALMNRIDFIGNTLFIPFFLISVGMLVDVNVIFNGTTVIIVTVVFSVVAIFSKWLAAWITQISFHYSRDQRQIIFGLSNAHAAETLAIIIVGYRAGILNQDILNGTILLILISSIVASFATERAAKRMVISGESDQLDSKTLEIMKHEHILLPVANVDNMHKLLEFVMLIKDKKAVHPVSVLTVVPNNNEAEFNMIKSRKKLEDFVRQASAAEIKTNVITTIDHNALSGITRIAREIMADLIVVGWPQRTGFFSKILNEKTENIINYTDKNLFISYFAHPLVAHKRIILLTPPLAELEPGFEFWIKKISIIANELTSPIDFYGDKKTYDDFHKALKGRNIHITITFHLFEDWEDFLVLSRYIKSDDLLILVGARKGSVSYLSYLDTAVVKINKYFQKNSKILIYPQQNEHAEKTESYEEVSSEPLVKSMEAIEKLGKGIGILLKKGKE
ncbi:cation:proton antiporter [Microbacter margulisiae]|uniref:Kef-type K+ transport system membrane component KefB/nucleotide-binding universal stress UspA family protein n=1 Tax=Microbacter margulisiae TaxID=1350067 RepID=A0A7W5DRT1_9PORP|nr:cation:proton antiporter [Microbacter margulisiae]MBB3187033.1 Kef-type K+ transport system membrane component KefB/nucleotide-binding universal stress UspA family protein [Microbacter margulisiae]